MGSLDEFLRGLFEDGRVVLRDPPGTEPEDLARASDRLAGAFAIHALDVAGPPIPFRVTVDGEAPGTAHGVDVDEDGNGVLHGGRLYQLVRQGYPVDQRTVDITFLAPGAEAFAFTYG